MGLHPSLPSMAMTADPMTLRGAVEIAAAVRNGSVLAVDVVSAALQRINQHDHVTNAFTRVTRERAMKEAAFIDDLRAAGKPLPPLAGVPYAVKDLFDVEGVTTLAGSRVLRSGRPACRDATSVEQMRAAGALLVGKLNMDEFAYGFTTENSHVGPCRNPRDPGRTAGGSSGGSAAAVAAGYVPIALGTDTNGSIRVPASCCGVFGIKPTYGRLSRQGVYPFVGSLDHVGAFSLSVDDLAAAYNALQFADPADLSCAKRAPEPVVPADVMQHVRVARLGGYFERHASDEVLAYVLAVCAALESTDVVEFDEADIARRAAFVISAAEGGALHLPGLRTSYDEHEPLSRDRLVAGSLMPAPWLMQAQRIRTVLLRRFLALFQHHDVLLAPATPVTAPTLGQETFTVGGEDVPVRAGLGLLTQPISLLGLPVVAVPLNTAERMPVGMQIIAPPWREDLAFSVARRIEACGLTRCRAAC